MTSLKKYESAVCELRKSLETAQAEEKIPSERSLARSMECSVPTIRRAIEILQREGLLLRKQGRRTVVASGNAPARPAAKTVLLLVLTEDAYFIEQTLEFQKELALAGYPVIQHIPEGLCESGGLERLRDTLRSHRDVAGMICGPVSVWYDKFAPVFEDLRHPFVAVGPTKPIDANYVAVNVADGIYEALRHLDQIGCRNIRFIGHPGNDHLWDRKAGLERFRSEFRPNESMSTLVAPAIGTIESGHSVAMGEFQAGRIPDGILAHNDLCAFGVLLAAAKCGIRIPEDMAMVGFDDISGAATSSPPLTSMQQPRREVAREAVRILGEAIAHPLASVRERTVLQLRLALRESTSGYPRAHQKIPEPPNAIPGNGDGRITCSTARG